MGQTYAFHSQKNTHDACPSGMDELLRGYSFMYFDSASGTGHGLPLSNPGSCMQDFSIQPIMECNSDTCELQGDDSSLWMPVGDIPEDMTASEYLPQEELTMGDATKAAKILQYISRCTVCKSPSVVLAIHSFTNIDPTCPEKWDELWLGYTFVMGRDRGGGSGQNMEGHGSCLKNFTPQMSVRCVMSGTSGEPNCHFQSQDQITAYVKAYNFVWENDENGNPADRMGIFDPMLKSSFSRCVVCRRKVDVQI